MKITFLGTGYSCDPIHRNLSILVENNDCKHLLDCGFNSAKGYLAHSQNTKLDTLWVSHFHGDHFFGIPQLLLHFYMQNRKDPLTIISGIDGENKIVNATHLAYPELSTKLSFSLNFIELQPGTILEHKGLNWQCSPVTHSQPAFALRLSNGSQSLYYSGDGRPSEQSTELMHNSNLVIHEAFSLEPNDPHHCSISECLILAEKHSIQKLALVHLDQITRQTMETNPGALQEAQSTEVIIPQDDEELLL